MPAGVVFVTATDYVTVYPTESETVFIASSTLSGSASTTLLQSAELLSSTIPTTTPQSKTPLQTLETASRIPTMTGISTLQSGFATPITSSEIKPWSDQMASLSLAAVILMVWLLISLLMYALYQRFRGKCHNCARSEQELEKWRKGDLKVITKDMVKSRESLNSQGSFSRSKLAPNGANEDLEEGNTDAERQAAREEALAVLTRPGSVFLKPSLWERTKGMMKPKGKQVEPSPERPPTIGDRFFTLPDVKTTAPLTPKTDYMLPQTRYEPPPTVDYALDPIINRSYSPPSPSVYSRATDYPIKRPGPQQSEHYVPTAPLRSPSREDSNAPKNTYSTYMRDEWRPPHLRPKVVDEGSVVSSTLNIGNPRHRARYDKAQRDMQRGSIADSELQKAVRDVNIIEKQMRGRRRSGGYGGLGEPGKS
ncbi:hypothetical protein BDU57DRAFT_597280 [Ampelomyces quisqualis]|uniref:Uncharacterized protein n=1 Tax=Ampelomyces quisqualis TaxID=50730 RepID=A0A6A5QB43_AMPQU|nr:hypothetical protein BDU57DRAFT_597280 [Ampelomyces quisqualis]